MENITREFRTHEKHEEIILLDHPDQFAEYRGFVGGLLCPYNPFTAEDDEIMMAFARATMAQKPNMHPRPHEPYHTPFWQLYPSTDQHPQCLRTAHEKAISCFTAAGGKLYSGGIIRINGSYPAKFHNHPQGHTDMTYTIFGHGTEVRSEEGGEFCVPARHLFMFDKNMWHRAYQKVSHNDIRLSLLV